MIRLLIVLLLAIPAWIEAAQAQGLTTRDGRPVRNVAIISRVGDGAVLFHAAMGVPIGTFVPERRHFTIPDFAIDARIERLIAGSLAPAFTVVQAGSDAALHDFAGWERRTVGQKIRALPPADGVDAYLVVCNDESRDEAGKTWLTIRGLGLYHRFRLFGHTTAVFAVYRVMLVDARTGDTIVDRESGMETGLFEPSLPWKRVDNSRWPGEEAMLTPDQVALLRDDLYALVDTSLPWTLRKMKLAP